MAGDVSTTPDSTLKSLKVENQQDRERKNEQTKRKKEKESAGEGRGPQVAEGAEIPTVCGAGGRLLGGSEAMIMSARWRQSYSEKKDNCQAP